MVESGNFAAVMSAARPDLSSDSTGSSQIRKDLAKYPNAKPAFKNAMQQEIAKGSERPRDTLRALSFGAEDGLMTVEDAAILKGELEKTVESHFASGQLDVDITDSEWLADFPAMNSAPNKSLLFERSLAKISRLTHSERTVLIRKVFAVASDGGDAYKTQLNVALPKLGLTTSELREFVVPYDRAVGEKLIESRARRVVLKTDPADRLLEEDAKDQLRAANEDISFVSSPGKDVDIVTLGKLQYDERVLPDRKETITYRQYEVNLVGALLLMPRDASYMYEHVTGGLEVNSAYLIKVERNAEIKIDKVFRDRISANFSTCENARIVNVFGGVQRAEFVANQDMQNRCSGNSTRPDPAQTKADILKKVAAEVMTYLGK